MGPPKRYLPLDIALLSRRPLCPQNNQEVPVIPRAMMASSDQPEKGRAEKATTGEEKEPLLSQPVPSPQESFEASALTGGLFLCTTGRTTRAPASRQDSFSCPPPPRAGFSCRQELLHTTYLDPGSSATSEDGQAIWSRWLPGAAHTLCVLFSSLPL